MHPGLGAILKFAVTKQVSGISVGTIGVVLMIVGIIGLLVTLAMIGARRRTEVRYHRDGVTYDEPSTTREPPL